MVFRLVFGILRPEFLFSSPASESSLPTDTTSVVGSSTSDELFVQAQSRRCQQFAMTLLSYPAVSRMTERHRSAWPANCINHSSSRNQRAKLLIKEKSGSTTKYVQRQTSLPTFARRPPTLISYNRKAKLLTENVRRRERDTFYNGLLLYVGVIGKCNG